MAPVFLDETPHHGETNSASSLFAARVAVHPIVGLEDALSLSRRNSLSLIFDSQTPRSIVGFRGHLHRLSIGPIAHCVVEEIQENLSQGRRVDVRDESALEVRLELNPMIAGERLEAGYDLVDLGCNIRHRRHDLVAIESGEIEDAFHEECEAAGLLIDNAEGPFAALLAGDFPETEQLGEHADLGERG